MRPRGARLLLVLSLTIGLLALPTARTTASSAAAANNTNVSSALNALTDYVSVKGGAPDPAVYAKSYILLDADTNTTLSSQAATTIQPIASTTKMVTALVARKYLKLDDVVTIHAEAEQLPETLIHLVPGEKITVGDLLKAALIQSGNDAAYSLAYYYNDITNPGSAVSYQPFVNKMNEFAAAHHLANTHFGDPAGLDDQDGRSDAIDLANIARLLLADPVLAQIVDMPQGTVSSTDGVYSHDLTNSNRLIQTNDPLYLPGVIGIKTGYTDNAGHCLVAAYNFNGHTLIGVVLNTDVYTATASASEMRKLFVWASSNIQVVTY